MKFCLLIMSIFILPFSMGCGQSFSSTDSAASTATAVATTVGTCTTGYVYTTAYGCLPQSTCSSGYALYNGVCISITSTATTSTATTANVTCASGYVYSSTYGCLPQQTCSTGYGWYNNNCVSLTVVTTVTTVSTVNNCQDYCPAGQVATDYGCMPADPSCPPCSGLGPDGYCYWSSYTLDTGLTY